MNKFITAALALVIALAAAACAGKTPEGAGQTEVIVFAAASMTETLEEIAVLYAEAEPDVTLTFNFDSSGTLKTQIQAGAECDLFISAGQLQMNQLDIDAPGDINTDRLDFVDGETRIDLLENRVALAAPDGNPKNIGGFGDLPGIFAAGDTLMAMGNADVPVGQYTQRILAYLGLDEEELARNGRITYGSNVKEVTTQIKEASVDFGVIYCTDAYSAGLDIIDYATAGMCGQVVYPAAVLKTAANPEAAAAFLDFLTTDGAMAVFEAAGFSKP
ncbi:MAG: molybdate ABC transporter substrate-binding protein [Clostridiales bacterium]|jgi:molybdate transport system substrate-binding protein|nr:molybdate ABC transporter substrate-binding protein [Clostridiales bacterium]